MTRQSGSIGAANSMRTGIVSLARFGINLGTENSYRIQQALDTLYGDGTREVFIPPVEGGIPLDRANCIKFRSEMMFHGVPGKTWFRGVGATTAAPAWPGVGGAMFALARPGTNDRYGVETGRIAAGVGVTVALTVVGGQVTAAAIAAGGTNNKVGDELTVTSGAASCVLTVATVASHRGAAATLTVKSTTANWGAPANPYATTSRGMGAQDRLIDVATVAPFYGFSGITLDGGFRYGDAALPAGHAYGGIIGRGCLVSYFDNVWTTGFPNSGIARRDTRRLIMTNCRSWENGWNGVYGTDRNGVTNVGYYLTDPSCKILNSYDDDIVSNVVCEDNGDVGFQAAWCKGRASGLVLRGNAVIQLEGEASAYATADTMANNGGVAIPANWTFSGMDLDGRMLNGHLAPTGTGGGPLSASVAYQLLSWAAGNEGHLRLDNVHGQACQNYALKHIQTSSGRATLRNVHFDNVNISADDGVRASAAIEFFNIERITGRRVDIQQIGSGIGMKVRGRHNFFDIDGLTVWGADTAIGQSTGAGVDVEFTQNGLNVHSFRLTGYHGRRLLAGMFRARCNNAANTMTFRQFIVEGEGTECNLHGTQASRKPIIDFQANLGANDGDGNLNIVDLKIKLRYGENSLNTLAAGVDLVNVSSKMSAASKTITVEVDAPQFEPSPTNAGKLAKIAPTTAPLLVVAPGIGQIGATNVATTIARGYREGQMFVVSGANGAAKFTDLIQYAGAGINPIEIKKTDTGGAPPARTYTLSGNNDIQLALASGTSTVVATPVAAS